MIRFPILIALSLLLATAACDLTGPDHSQRVVGILVWQNSEDPSAAVTPQGSGSVDEVIITAPSTATAGVPFDVEVRTVGLTGCWNEDGEDVSVSGTTASVTPYDLVVTELDGSPAVCTQALVSLVHSFQLAFPEHGSGILKVIGRRVTENDISTAVPLEHEVAIEILPAGS